MADGTRLAHLAESLKECQDSLLQQQTSTTSFQQQQLHHNTSLQQQITDLTEMFLNFVTTQGRLSLERLPLVDPSRPHLEDPPHYLMFIPGRADPRLPPLEGRDGQDDRRMDRDIPQAFGHDG
jgi:hypothetical protein